MTRLEQWCCRIRVLLGDRGPLSTRRIEEELGQPRGYLSRQLSHLLHTKEVTRERREIYKVGWEWVWRLGS